MNGILKKTARLAGAAFAAALLTCPAHAETLKIGIIGPMTGGGAAWGLAAAEAGTILANEVNAKGGLQVGGKNYKVEIVVYDDKYNTAEAIAAYNRLVNRDGVRFMVIQTSSATVALKKNVEDDKVVALTSSYTTKALDKNTRYMFRLYSSPAQYVPSFVAWMKANLPGRRIALINPNDETGWDISQVSDRALKANGFDVLGSELFERTQKDFEPMLTKIIALKPDMIDLGSTPPATAGLIVRQARELGYGKLFVKLGGPGPREIVAAAGAKAAEGTINVLYADPANDGWRHLASTYKTHRGHDGNEILVAYYDGMNILLHAIRQAGTAEDTTKVAAAFAKALPMKSAQGDELRLGGMSYYGSNTEVLTVNYIGVIRNGEPVVIGKTK